MCGIFLYLKKSKISLSLRKQVFKNFMKSMHRGPDNSTFSNLNKETKIILGFHRLRINDISQKGQQPLYYLNSNIKLICNGEIYNWKEIKEKYNFTMKSSSDCEVILHLYNLFKGDISKVINNLHGVFCFIIIDLDRDIISICRDAIGIRVSFIGTTKDSITIASELKSIHNLCDKNSMKQFPPGCFTQIKLNEFYNIDNYNIQYNKFYHFKYTIKDYSEEEILKNIRIELEKAVHMRIENADVNVASIISGGLDSSLITAIAAKKFNKLNKILHTFTIGIKNEITGENESPDVFYARKVAKYYKNIHHHEYLVTKDELIKNLEDTIYQVGTYDVTTIRASTCMWMLSKFIKNTTDQVVILSGEGMDELGGGYKGFSYQTDGNKVVEECIRLMKNLYNYDILRADHSSSFGLELRTPFLDTTFIDTYMSFPSKYKLSCNKIEKYLIRKAFEKDYLPQEVLWRPKEAFSDGVSSKKNSWHHIIQHYVEKKFNDDDLAIAKIIYKVNPPLTKEALYYRKIFTKFYPKAQNIIPYIWQHSWGNKNNDPSARDLDNYNKQLKIN